MIHGVSSIGRVQEESICRTAKDYRFTELGLYKVHSNSLLPNVTFEEESNQPFEIDHSIFLNDEETTPIIEDTIECQNYVTTKFIGRAPLEWYDKDQTTKMGRQFLMVCKGGNPNASYRVFGTEDAIRGYNRNASENIKLPGGGENT